MEYVYDLPEDARPDCTYGTPEFEAKRLSRWGMPRRHVKPEAPAAPIDVKTMLAGYADIRNRLQSKVAPAPRPLLPVADIIRELAAQPRSVWPRDVLVEATLYPYEFTVSPMVYAYDFGPAQHRLKVLPSLIVRETADFYGVELSKALSQGRTKSIAKVRQIAMYLIWTKCGRSYREAARAVRRNDHTTAVHAVQKISALLGHDAQLASDVETIATRLGLGELE